MKLTRDGVIKPKLWAAIFSTRHGSTWRYKNCTRSTWWCMILSRTRCIWERFMFIWNVIHSSTFYLPSSPEGKGDIFKRVRADERAVTKPPRVFLSPQNALGGEEKRKKDRKGKKPCSNRARLLCRNVPCEYLCHFYLSTDKVWDTEWTDNVVGVWINYDPPREVNRPTARVGRDRNQVGFFLSLFFFFPRDSLTLFLPKIWNKKDR